MDERRSRKAAFVEEAGKKESGILGEFWGYLKANKKWWLLPIVLALVLVGVLVLAGGSAAAPFIYTLF